VNRIRVILAFIIFLRTYPTQSESSYQIPKNLLPSFILNSLHESPTVDYPSKSSAIQLYHLISLILITNFLPAVFGRCLAACSSLGPVNLQINLISSFWILEGSTFCWCRFVLRGLGKCLIISCFSLYTQETTQIS
jgi:hypothetical protein